MNDWQCRPKTGILGRFYFFGGAATAERATFFSRFPSLTNQTLRQLNIGPVSYTLFT